MIFKFVEIELKNAGSKHLEEKERRFRTGAVMHSSFFFWLYILEKKDVALRVAGTTGGDVLSSSIPVISTWC